jgi:hypothetical protein
MIIDQLSSLADDVAALEPWRLTDSELGAVESTGLAKDDGAASTTAWFANLTGVSRRDASRLVGLSRVTSRRTEQTRAAWAAGELSTEKARVIMRAIDALPDDCTEAEVAAAETRLVADAARFDLDDLQRLANRIREVMDPEGFEDELGRQVAAEEKRAWEATRLAMHDRGDGTTKGTFVIPGHSADTLRAAIEGIIAPRRNRANAERHGLAVDDLLAMPRAQRMGLAFLELIDHLPPDALPQAGGLAATVTVNVDLDVLRSGVGTATSSSGTTVSAGTASRMACNAHLVALYLDTESRVTDVGLSKRLFDRHQRHALAQRDRGCVWQGCDQGVR